MGHALHDILLRQQRRHERFALCRRRRQHDHTIADLDAEESVTERVARLLTHQAGARAGSSPETRKMTRQSLSTKSDKSAGSDVMSGSQPSTPKLTFDDEVVAAPTPEESEEGTRAS